MATKVTAQPAEAMDRIDKSLTAPPLEVVIMTGVRLALMGTLRHLHMGVIVTLGVVNTMTNHHFIFAAPGKIPPPMVVRNKHLPTGAPAVMRGKILPPKGEPVALRKVVPTEHLAVTRIPHRTGDRAVARELHPMGGLAVTMIIVVLMKATQALTITMIVHLPTEDQGAARIPPP